MHKEVEAEIMLLKKEIETIKTRNRRVEADKDWETSAGRKIILAVITYVLIGLYMMYLRVNLPWLNALVPTAGFLISTLTLSWAKNIWTRK